MSKEEIEKAKEYFKYLTELSHKDIENHKQDEFKGYGTLEDSAKLKYCNLKIIDNYIDQLEQENNKQSKIIDEMVDCIWNYDICDYEITDYTYRKCEYIADNEEKPCKECIRQYFEKKVED